VERLTTELNMRVPRRQPGLSVRPKIVCEFRDEHAAFIGELPIGNPRTVGLPGQADFQAIIVWKDNFPRKKNAQKMQDKYCQY
jgi:hypothetical protein